MFIIEVVSRMEPESNRALIDKLAAVEHDQWIAWSKDVASKEDLSPLRIRRWKAL